MKKLSSYATKRRLGLVPSHYDKDSKSFNLGAHKHWEGIGEYRRKALAFNETAARIKSDA